MLPDGPSSAENIMTLPTDVNLNLSITSSTIDNYGSSIQIKIEQIYPGIYLTNFDNNFWTNDRLRSHGFTHIIIIDKHIHQNYIMTTTTATASNNLSSTSTSSSILSSSSSSQQQQDQIRKFKMNYYNNNNNDNSVTDANLISHQHQHQQYSQQQQQQQQIAFKYTTTATSLNPSSNLNKTASTIINSNEFELLNLNFCEESYLTTVLPNCYKAVKFIDKALQYGGSILCIDYLNNQKCLTIVTAYLMYKNNLNFNDAFQKIKKYNTVELDKFFISQLYEYEPILQVQRAQSKGHSCSRELRMAHLKRKKLHNDDDSYINSTITTNTGTISTIPTTTTTTNESPLSSSSTITTYNGNFYNCNLSSYYYITTGGSSLNNFHDTSDVCME